MAFGNDYSINLAVIKALAESVERKSSGLTRVDLRSKLNENCIVYLDPQEHIPLNENYVDFSNFFDKFDINKQYEWVIGQSILDQSDIAVLVDSVFYPFAKEKLNRKPIHWASSNGVAAHTERYLAIQNGIYELIERDAIMVNWYAQTPVNKVTGDIPHCVSDRVKIWKEKYGYKINHIDLKLESLPVVVTTFYNPHGYPCFVAGAGCGDNYAVAIEKSFAEAEFMLTSWSENKQDKITPEEVKEVHDHALLYFYPDHIDKLQFILNAEEKWVDVNHVYDIDSIKKFEPIVIDLKRKNFPEDLCVVQVLSKKLMPINFGYGLEAYKHNRINELGLQWVHDYPAFPHYFA